MGSSQLHHAELLSPELLKEMAKTPQQRRSEQEKYKQGSSSRARRSIARSNRGLRLKLAFTKLSQETLVDLRQQLHDFTREEVYKKIMFITGKSQWSAKKNGKVTKFTLKTLSSKDECRVVVGCGVCVCLCGW